MRSKKICTILDSMAGYTPKCYSHQECNYGVNGNTNCNHAIIISKVGVEIYIETR